MALRYDDSAAGIDEQQEFEALYGPLDDGLDLDAETIVDFDDRDFRPDAPAGAAYVLPQAPIAEAKLFTAAAKDIQARLVANRALELYRNRELKLTSRPGESQEDFLAALRRGRPGEGGRGGGEDPGPPGGEGGAAAEGARARAAPRRGARHPDAVASGERR